VLTPIAVRPAVEATILHRCQIIRNQVAAELVALVDDRPELAAHPRHSVGVAQAGRVEALLARVEVNLPDGGATLLLVDAVLGGIAVRAHGGIEPLAVRTGDDVLGPVMIEGAPGRSAILIPGDRISVTPSV
jgi:hypothetical protein